MRKTPRTLLITGLILASPATLVACGGTSGAKEGTMVGATADSVILDVRTVAEFGEGHLEGAVNYDVEDGTFAAQLATLDKNASYVLYCRSGRRSAIAADMMKSAGFAHVTDLGAMEDAASTLDKQIVTN